MFFYFYCTEHIKGTTISLRINEVLSELFQLTFLTFHSVFPVEMERSSGAAPLFTFLSRAFVTAVSEPNRESVYAFSLLSAFSECVIRRDYMLSDGCVITVFCCCSPADQIQKEFESDVYQTARLKSAPFLSSFSAFHLLFIRTGPFTLTRSASH